MAFVPWKNNWQYPWKPYENLTYWWPMKSFRWCTRAMKYPWKWYFMGFYWFWKKHEFKHQYFHGVQFHDFLMGFKKKKSWPMNILWIRKIFVDRENFPWIFHGPSMVFYSSWKSFVIQFSEFFMVGGKHTTIIIPMNFECIMLYSLYIVLHYMVKLSSDITQDIKHKTPHR